LQFFQASLFSGRARVAPEDANSPERSGWARTQVLQQDYIGEMTDDGFAQALAQLILSEFEGIAPRDVTVTLPRGNHKLHWGMKVKPKMQRAKSDTTIGLDGVELRVTGAEHEWNWSGGDALQAFVSVLTCRTLSGNGF
jgi:hypothetical protein